MYWFCCQQYGDEGALGSGMYGSVAGHFALIACHFVNAGCGVQALLSFTIQ
jgi:hypothetical protein